MRTYSYAALDECPMCSSRDQKIMGRRLDRHQGLRPRRVKGVGSTVVRCAACGLVFANPQALPVSLGDHYDKPPEEYWSARPEYFEEDIDLTSIEQSLRRLMPQVTSPRCLDVGAGLGHMMQAMRQRGFDVYGIEPSAAFVERAVAEGLPPERLQCVGVDDADFPAESFDFIVFTAVLEHLPHPGRALERILSWLRTGGLVFVEVPSADWLLARGMNLAYRLLGTEYVTNLSPMHDPYHLSEFTLQSFERHGERAGYVVAEHEWFVCKTFLPKPLDGLAHRLMERTHTGMEIAVWLTPNRARAHG